MPIKIFEGPNVEDLGKQVDKFIVGKKVLQTSMSTSPVGTDNKFFPSGTKYQILVYYEGAPKTGNKQGK